MDYGKLTLEELKKGYIYDLENDKYICNYCEQSFENGQIFSIDDNFYTAEHAIKKHIDNLHKGNLSQLLASETKYNTLTQKQKNLITLFNSGISDKYISKKLNVTEATIRRQRFTFREKAKQAKFYLAIYSQVFERTTPLENSIVPIHNNAKYLDDRYLITEQERKQILNTFFSSLSPLKLIAFSPKEKKKVVILTKIAEQFKKGKYYTEKEINEILKSVFDDFITIRRYLIMYGFIDRTTDGSKYWLTE